MLLLLAGSFGCTNHKADTYTLPDAAEETPTGAPTELAPETPKSEPAAPTSPDEPAPEPGGPAAVSEIALTRGEMTTTPAIENPPQELPNRDIKLLVPEREFSTERSANALRVTFDDINLLRVINMEKITPDVVSHMPGWLTALNGQRIILRGWMFPPARQDGISRFIFVRDNGVCCFGPNAKIYDKLAVTLKSGTHTRFIEGRAFDVIGTLTIEPDLEDPDNAWLYHLEDAQVRDK